MAQKLSDSPLFTWDNPIIDVHAHPRGLGSTEVFDAEAIDELVAYSRRTGVVRMVSLGEVSFRRGGFSKVEIRWLNDRNAELATTARSFMGSTMSTWTSPLSNTYRTIDDLRGSFSPDRVLYGSRTPLFVTRAASMKVAWSEVGEDAQAAIARGNAAGLFGL